MSTVDVQVSGDAPTVLPVSATDAVAAAQAYLVMVQSLLVQIEQSALVVQEYSAIAQAAAAAASANAALAYKRTTVADANYAVAITDIYIEYTSMSGAHVLTLPAAASCVGGRPITVADASGSCSSTNTITLALQPGDNFVGVSSAPYLAAPGASLQVYPTSEGSWVVRA